MRPRFESFYRHSITRFSRHPDELYKNGIQRSSFIPAIDLIKERLEIINLDSGTGALSWNMYAQVLILFHFKTTDESSEFRLTAFIIP